MAWDVRGHLSDIVADETFKRACGDTWCTFKVLEYNLSYLDTTYSSMLTFILWLILFIICWPIAIAALILYPFVWLLLLPFRLLGFAVELSFDLVKNIFMLPFRLVGVK